MHETCSYNLSFSSKSKLSLIGISNLITRRLSSQGVRHRTSFIVESNRAAVPASPTKRQTISSKPAKTVSNGKAKSLPATNRRGTQQGTKGKPAPGRKTQKETKPAPPSRFYFNVTGYPFPLGPFFSRKTIRKEIDPGSLWVFEQEQGLGFSNVSTNVRMTVIRLTSGGLWVHAPVAPTKECVALLKELGYPVEYIVLPTFAYEHKVFMGPFTRAFPKAKAYVAPSQWSWPVNLPVQFFGIFPTGVVEAGAEMPWSDQIEHKCFSSPVGIGPYSEVVFFHKKSRTLLVTDSVIYVPPSPPEVVTDEALLEAGGPLPLAVKAFSGGDGTGPDPPPPPTEAARKLLGWKRMALQILFFAPFNLLKPDESFRAVSERLLVSPVVKTLVFNNAKDEARQWADEVAEDWNFRRIIPCHFAGPVLVGPADWRAAFSFLRPAEEVPAPKKPGLLGSLLPLPLAGPPAPRDFLPQDLRALNAIETFLKKAGVLYT